MSTRRPERPEPKLDPSLILRGGADPHTIFHPTNIHIQHKPHTNTTTLRSSSSNSQPTTPMHGTGHQHLSASPVDSPLMIGTTFRHRSGEGDGTTAPPSTPIVTNASSAASYKTFATQPRPTARPASAHSFNSTPVRQGLNTSFGGGRESPEDEGFSPLIGASPKSPPALLSPGQFRAGWNAKAASSATKPTPTGNKQTDSTYQRSSEEEDEESTPIVQSKPSSRLFSSRQHPQVDQLPISMNAVARDAPNPTSSSTFPPFSPSELRPYSSPSPVAANGTTAATTGQFPPFSPSEIQLESPAAGPAKKYNFGKGFSPRHSHWDPDHEYDEVYELEPSPKTSPQSSPRLPAKRGPAQMMSPGTKSAADSLVPSISWLLILNRKLLLSTAITSDQSRHLKNEILSGNPQLLSAVDRFVRGENQDAIITALMNCLPEIKDDEEQLRPNGEDGSDAGESDAGSDDSDGDYRRILNKSQSTPDTGGRGEGGHKVRPSRAERGIDDASLNESATKINFDDNDEDEEEEEEENPLIIANSLLPLSLPDLESLHQLIRELGFNLIDLETLHLCTSSLVPSFGSVPPVTLAAWTECIKSLRLHSNSPKLFTQLLTSIYHVLDLQSTGTVPYGELVSSLAVFCKATKQQKLKFIFQTMARNNGVGANSTGAVNQNVTASPLSPLPQSKNKSASTVSPGITDTTSLPCPSIYGFLFSWSLTLHVFLVFAHSKDASTVDVKQTINLENKLVWELTNKFYVLLDSQFELLGDQEDENTSLDRDASLSYQQFMSWTYSPVFVLETLFDQTS